MNRPSRYGGPGLLARHVLSDPFASLLVALLVFATVLAVALAPRAMSGVGTEEVRHRLAALPALERDLRVTGQLGASSPEPVDSAAELFGWVGPSLDGVRRDIAPPLADLLGDPHWVALVSARSAERAVPAPGPRPVVGIVADPDWLSRIEIVEGVPPAPWDGDETDGRSAQERPPIEVVLAHDAAATMEVAVGDVLQWSPAPIVISGLFAPLNSEDPYWQHVHELPVARLQSTAGGELAVASGFIDPESAVGLQQTFEFSELRAWFPVNGDRLEFADAAPAARQIDSLAALGARSGSGMPLTLRSGVGDAILGAIDRVAAASALLALVASGPLGVVFAAFSLGVQSVLRRRAPALSLASARGASGAQLRGAMALEGALLAIPPAAAAIAIAALLLPTRIAPSAVLLPGVLALIPPALFAVLTDPRRLRTTRSPAETRPVGRRRWIVEAIVGGLAIVALLLLWRRGLAATGAAVGIDPLLVATPLLCAAAVALLVLRVLPLPLRAVQAAMRRRRGAIGMVGAARAVRDPVLGVAPAFALVVGMSVAVFSTVLAATVALALRDGVEESVGAPIQVRAERLGPGVQELVAGVDGVQGIAPLVYAPGVELMLARHATELTAVATDTAVLQTLRPDIPAGMDSAAGGIPILVSAAVAAEQGEVTVAGEPARIVGVIQTTFPGPGERFIIVDSAFAQRIGAGAQPARLLVGVTAGTDPADVAPGVAAVVVEAQRRSAQAGVVVEDTTTALAAAEGSPVIGGLQWALVIAAVASAVLSLLTVVVASVSAAASRHRILGVLRTLGTPPSGQRRLLLWELGPVAAVGIVAGTALGIGLTWLVTAAVDLRAFLGGSRIPGPVLDGWTIAAVVAGFALAVAVSGAIAAAIGRRLNPTMTLKIGAE